MSADHDPERDAYLSEALRHAPDAALAPPAALSDAILRQARSATTASLPADALKPAPASTPWARAPRRPIADFWLWLARPQVAGGFASVLAATLVGMLWWDRPMDDATPRAHAPSTTTPAPAPARSDGPGQGPLSPPAEMRAHAGEARLVPNSPAKPTPEARTPTPTQTRTPAAQRAEKATATESATDAQPHALSAAPKDASKRDDRSRIDTPVPQPFPATPRHTTGDALMRERRQQTESSAAVPDRPVAAPATGAAPAVRDELQAAAEAPRKERAPVGQEQAPAFDKASRNAAGAAAGSLSRSTESSGARPASLPLRNLRIALGEEPQRWAWERDAGRPQPIDAALRMWLARLEAALADSNAEIAAGTTRGEADSLASNSVQTLRLLRDGQAHSVLRLDGDSVRIETLDDPSAAGMARLRPSAAAELKAAMPPERR